MKSDQRLFAVPGDVRRDDDVLPPAQRVRIGKRLGVDRVERTPGDLPGVECPNQRIGVDDGPARAIDDERRRFHARQGFVADHLPGLGCQRRMQRQEVRPGQQIHEFSLLAGNIVASLLDEGIGKKNAHAEGRRAPRHLPGDVAKADQAERPARQPEHGLPWRNLPPAAAHQPIVDGNLASAGEDQRHRVLGDFLDAVGRVVGDDDARLRGGVEIDGVHADAVTGDDPALGHLRHRLCRDRPSVGIEQRVAVRGLRQKLLRLFRLQRHEVGQIAQGLLLHIQGTPDVVGHDHFRFIRHADSRSGRKVLQRGSAGRSLKYSGYAFSASAR